MWRVKVIYPPISAAANVGVGVGVLSGFNLQQILPNAMFVGLLLMDSHTSCKTKS